MARYQQGRDAGNNSKVLSSLKGAGRMLPLFICTLADNDYQHHTGGVMSIALIGGMERLERHYISEAEKLGFKLKVFSKSEVGFGSKIKNIDAMVILTNKISHMAKKEAMNTAKSNNIPVFMYHSCGVCTLRDCFSCLKENDRRRVGRCLERIY